MKLTSENVAFALNKGLLGIRLLGVIAIVAVTVTEKK